MIPPGPRLGRHRGRQAAQGSLASASSSTTCRSRCRATALSASSAPMASARPRSLRPSSAGDPDAGKVQVGETSTSPMSTRTVPASTPGQEPLGGRLRRAPDHIKVGQVEIPSRAYVSQFGFRGPDQQKKAGVLSGGERNRLNLALTLKQGGNLLLPDELTNDPTSRPSARWRTRCSTSRVRRRHQPRPVVPRSASPRNIRVGGHRRGPEQVVLSEATSRPTRRTRSNAPGGRLHARIRVTYRSPATGSSRAGRGQVTPTRRKPRRP